MGVVLTGGGGHGLAHLGALRALEDSGVPIDCVGGTSQGALMAALYARHASTTHMLPQVKDLVGVLSSSRHLLTDLTLPVLSIFSGKGLDSILQAVLGDTDIEDLWLCFFCCSTNLTRGWLSTHTSGTVWRYVRASMTVLGLLPPVYDRGELLVDGGYLNSIPVDVMRERMGVETVIVVDVEDNDYLAFRNLTPHDGGLGGWRLLWERVNPFGSWFGKWFMGDGGGGGGGGGERARRRRRRCRRRRRRRRRHLRFHLRRRRCNRSGSSRRRRGKKRLCRCHGRLWWWWWWWWWWCVEG